MSTIQAQGGYKPRRRIKMKTAALQLFIQMIARDEDANGCSGLAGDWFDIASELAHQDTINEEELQDLADKFMVAVERTTTRRAEANYERGHSRGWAEGYQEGFSDILDVEINFEPEEN